MGDNVRSKTKLGYRISTKIISILLVLLLTTTAFSSIIVAQEPTSTTGDDSAVYETDDSGDSSKGAAQPALGTQFKSLFQELSILRKSGTPIFSVVTKYNDTETTTRLKRFLPTAIDVNGDGKKDIRVWLFRLPGIDLRPPAACIKTTLFIRRLNDDIKYGPFEIYLQWTPKIISKLTKTALPSIRIGYQSPAGEEVPKYCVVTHKDIPHLLYPRLKTTHRIAINPGPAVGKSQLNLLFSIVNDTAQSKLTITVNHNPAVKNELSLGLSRDYFIRRGQTLEISRKNTASNVSLTISDILGDASGSLTINNLPKKITLSWLLTPKGHIELNTHGSSTGKVAASVDGAISLGFKPETGISFRLGWDVDRLTRIGALIALKKGKSFDLTFDASASATLSDLYVNMPDKLGLTASLFSLNLKGGVEAGNVVIKPYAGADTVSMNVENADVLLRDCNINLITVEPPAVNITSPNDGDAVHSIVTITGTASAPPGKEIKSVSISIDGGDSIIVDGTTAWSYNWDTTSLPNGEHTITAQSFDGDSNSAKYTITVTVNNAGNNWKPSVKITTPSNYQILNGVVHITGTANDPDGDELLVNLQVYNILKSPVSKEIELQVDGSGNWHYDWDATNITAGLYTIYVQSYDGKCNSTTDSVSVWVKLKCNLDLTLSEASINVTNFVINSESLTLGVSSFALSGNGSVNIGGDSVSLEASGSLDIQDTSITITNETSVTTTLLDNLDVNFDGQGSVFLSKSAISIELNASIYIHADGALSLEDITFNMDGKASAKISFDDSGKITIGKNTDEVVLDIKDLFIGLGDIISAGADGIYFDGTGNISIVDKKLLVDGDSIECGLDNLYVNTDVGVLYLSGGVNFSQYGIFAAEFTDLLNFNISYRGISCLEITDPRVEIRSPFGNASASVNPGIIKIYPTGYVDFSFYMEDAKAVCYLNFSSISISKGLTLVFNEYSLKIPFEITGKGSFKFLLFADIVIEHALDWSWIRITIGGKGNAQVTGGTEFSSGDKKCSFDVDIELAAGDRNFTIYLYNLTSKNKGFDIDGGASVNLNKFDLTLSNITSDEDLVSISIEDLKVGFDMQSSGGKIGDEGSISFNVNDAGITLENGHVFIYLIDQYCFSLSGLVNVSTSVGASGTIEATWNKSGLKFFEVDFDTYINVSIEDLDFRYTKYNNTRESSIDPPEIKTDIILSAEKISVNKNSNFVITPDYIHVKINPDDYSEPPAQESPDTKEFAGILLKNLYLNATLSDDAGATIDIDSLTITSGMDIYYDGNISIIASGRIIGDDIFVSAGIKYGIEYLYVSIDIDSLDVYAQGTAEITLKDKNISLYGYGDHTDITLVGANVNVIFTQYVLFLTLKELDIVYTGSAEINANYDNSGFTLKATLIDDGAYIKIKTLWAFLSFTFVEIRLDDFAINGDTTVTFDVTNEMLVTIHTDDTITIRAVSLSISGLPNIRLYGVSNNAIAGGSSISIGFDRLRNLMFGVDGSWHVNVLFVNLHILNLLILKNIDVVGELSHVVLGFDSPVTFLQIEGTAIRQTNLHLEFPTKIRDIGIDAKLNQGAFSLTADIDQLGVFVYTESYATINLTHPLLPKPYFSFKVKGLIEFSDLNMTVAGDEEPYDEVLSMDYKICGEVDIANRWNINGTGYGSISMETSGKLIDKIMSLDLDCYGRSLYITWRNIIKVAINGTLHVNHQSWAFDEESGEIQFETSEALVTINQNTQQVNINTISGDTVEIYANGQIILNGVAPLGPAQNQQVQQQVQQILDNILPGIIWIWIKRLNGEWLRIWPINPDGDPPLIKAATTLITRKSDDVALNIGTIKIIPGDKVNFTAWCRPGEESSPSDYYIFTFDFGEGNTSVVNVSKSITPLKVYSDIEPQYFVPGTYTATVTVTDGSLEIASDTTTINVVEEYLTVDANIDTFDYEEISGQPIVHGYFTVNNIANESCSNYVLHWNMSIPTEMGFGTNWSFEPIEGILTPNRSQIVNFSFTLKPSDLPGDYESPEICFYDRNNTNVNDDVTVSVYYGLVQIWPNYTTNYLVKKGSNTTLDEVFWITSTRFEKLDWEIASTSVVGGDTSTFEFGFNPSSGTLPPDNSYANVDLWINAENEDFTGCTINVTFQRKNDIHDSANVTIVIKAADPDILQNWISPDSHVESDWDREDYAYDQMPKLTWSVYKEVGVNDWSDTLTLKKNTPITINGFEIRARKETHLDKMEIKLYNGNTQVGSTLTYTDWPNRDWKVVDLGGQYTVNKVVIRFHEDAPFTGFWVHRAFVYEFYFMQEYT